MAFRNWLTEDEKRNIEEDLTQIIRQTRDEIIALGSEKWKPCPETRAMEREIERIQHEIFAGSGTISDFQEACERWKRSGLIRT